MNHPLKLSLCILLTTAAFAADDWQTLFNDKDLTGWKANVYPDSWSVADGVLRAKATKESSHLFFVGERTEGLETFKDFQMELEARSEPNSEMGKWGRCVMALS